MSPTHSRLSRYRAVSLFSIFATISIIGLAFMLIYNSRFENYQSHNAYMKVEEYDNLRQSNAKTLDVSAYSTFAMINA